MIMCCETDDVLISWQPEDIATAISTEALCSSTA